MRQRRTIRVLALLATLLLTAFGVTSLATASHASPAQRLATLRAMTHQATHGQNVSLHYRSATSTHTGHHDDAAQHGLDAVLPPSDQSVSPHRGHHRLNTSKPGARVGATLRSHDGRAPPAVA